MKVPRRHCKYKSDVETMLRCSANAETEAIHVEKVVCTLTADLTSVYLMPERTSDVN